MINISDAQVLEEYLARRGLVRAGDGHELRYCKGGVSGTVVYVERPGQPPMIVKQALAQLKVAETWLCDPSRMAVEYESNRIYHELMPESTPEVYFYDGENYIYGREAVPDSCTMWKADLMSGLLDFEVARKAALTLATVHSRCAGSAGVAARFAGKEVFYNLRIDPYIRFILDRYPQLTEQAEQVCREMMESGITLVHGDYSPKNIMVRGREIAVLDYEVAHYGHPAFDLAFLLNHIMLKSIHFPHLTGAFRAMFREMARQYLEQPACMDKTRLEECTVRTLAFLMLARVDGKSPAEYLTQPQEKEQVRRVALALLAQKASTLQQAADIADALDPV